MSKRLSGLNPLAYLGVEPLTPPNMYQASSAPTPNDSRGFNLGDLWIDTSNESLYVLVSLVAGVATWITTFGGATTNFITDSGTATESGGNIHIVGDGTLITTSGSGSTVTISGDTSPSFSSVTTNALTINGMTEGVLISDNSGHISSSATTNHSILIGNSTGTVSSLGAATNGQIPIGSTGADPVLATITAGTGIAVTNGAGSITIATTGAAGTTVFHTGSGDATESGGAITIAGGNNISTSGAASTVTVAVSGTSNHQLQVGNASGSLTSLGAATNGQIPIGSTGASPVLATITGGAGINVTNGAGSITIATTGSSIQTVTVSLTNAQIKNLKATPILALAAQGANTIIQPISSLSFLSYGGSNVFVAPVSESNINLYYTSTATTNNYTGLTPMSFTSYTQSQSNYQSLALQSNAGIATATIVDQPIYLALDSTASAEITGNAANDNTITIKIEYQVLTVPL